jgi:hypothetical protein
LGVGGDARHLISRSGGLEAGCDAAEQRRFGAGGGKGDAGTRGGLHDSRGLILQIHAASVQDRDGAIHRCGLHGHGFHSSSGPSPIAPIPPNEWRKRPGSSSRSCASRLVRSALPCIPGVGWSNASSPGSAATAVWPRISRGLSPQQPPSFMPLPSCSSPDGSLVPYEIRVGL